MAAHRLESILMLEAVHVRKCPLEGVKLLFKRNSLLRTSVRLEVELKGIVLCLLASRKLLL